jgi:hypothetical protein
MEKDDLPSNLNPKELRFVGFGLDSLRTNGTRKLKVVQLDPDVAREFVNAEEVNQALRLVKQLREVGKPKHRKSA